MIKITINSGWLLMLFLLSVNAIAKNQQSLYRHINKPLCQEMGYPHPTVVNLSKQIKDALDKNDRQKMSSFMSYPLRINYYGHCFPAQKMLNFLQN